MEKYYLKYEPAFKAFCVNDSILARCINESVIPSFGLTPSDYHRVGCKPPLKGAPIVGLLMGRDENCYSAGWEYVLALAKTGVEIRFLTYHHCTLQLQECHALVLPGGVFDLSEGYYADSHDDAEYASLRHMAYAVCIRYALENNMPILGIDTGAQLVAGELGLKLYRSLDDIETPINHNTEEPKAHRLHILPQTPLRWIFGGDNLFFVNSRHRAPLAPFKVQCELWADTHKIPSKDVQLPLDLYAEANDGTPEAWGSEEKHILCMQWHPENMAEAGDDKMQGIFQWMADEAERFYASDHKFVAP